MTLEDLDLAVESCLEKKKGINMGIGGQFFYRSLYAVQLHNCFKVRPLTHSLSHAYIHHMTLCRSIIHCLHTDHEVNESLSYACMQFSTSIEVGLF